jgi:hypothetical protein
MHSLGTVSKTLSWVVTPFSSHSSRRFLVVLVASTITVSCPARKSAWTMSLAKAQTSGSASSKKAWPWMARRMESGLTIGRPVLLAQVDLPLRGSPTVLMMVLTRDLSCCTTR